MLAMDALGVIHVAYVDAANPRVVYARDVDGWAPIALDDADVSIRPSLAVDAAGHASVAYVSAGVVKFSTNRSGSWTTSAVTAGRIGLQDSLALDASGRPVVTISAANSDIALATQTVAGLSFEAAFPFIGGSCGFSSVSIALESNGTAHLGLLQTCHSFANIGHGFRSGPGWQFELLPTPSDYSIFRADDPAIVVSGDGRIHIAARASGFAREFLTYWTNATGAWLPYTLANAAGGLGSLRVDASGDRHAVYVTDRDVRYLTTRH